MYIEISPRGAGKTYRLIGDIVRYLSNHPDENVYVIGPTSRTARFVLKDPRVKDLVKRIKIVENPDRLRGINNPRVYVEEVQMCNHVKDIYENGYYVGTVDNRFNIRDITKNQSYLLRLLRANNYNFNTVFPFDLYDSQDIRPILETGVESKDKIPFENLYLNYLFEFK